MKQNIIVFTDPNKDTDDLTALIMLSNLHKIGKINIAGIVTTHGDFETTLKRAMYSSGVLNLLHLPISICAGIGLNLKNDALQKSSNMFYLNGGSEQVILNADRNQVKTDSLSYLKSIFLKQNDNSIDLLIIAQMTDVANFIVSEQKLFLNKVRTVTIMGGFNKDNDNYLTPDSSANNANDLQSANIVFNFLKSNKIATSFINRYAVMEVPVNWEYFEKLKQCGSIVGTHAYEIQAIAFKNLFIGLLNGESLKRQTPEWFFETFTDIPKNEFEIWKEKCYGEGKEIAIKQIIDRIVRFNLYDPLALLACVDEYKKHFYVESFDSFSLYNPKNKNEIYKLFDELMKVKLI